MKIHKNIYLTREDYRRFSELKTAIKFALHDRKTNDSDIFSIAIKSLYIQQQKRKKNDEERNLFYDILAIDK